MLVRIRQVIPGTFAHSVTAFGREFISFHNHITGTDIPMQWDNSTTLERVSQDGPGASPVVGSISAALTIVSLTQPPAVLNTSFNNPIRGITWNNGPGLTGTGNIVTLYYSLADESSRPEYISGRIRQDVRILYDRDGRPEWRFSNHSSWSVRVFWHALQHVLVCGNKQFPLCGQRSGRRRIPGNSHNRCYNSAVVHDPARQCRSYHRHVNSVGPELARSEHSNYFGDGNYADRPYCRRGHLPLHAENKSAHWIAMGRSDSWATRYRGE